MSRAKIVLQYLKILEDRYPNRALTVVETGSIRSINPQYVMGDGHSTYFVASYLHETEAPHTFISIDLDISVAQAYMAAIGLSNHVTFMQGNSLKMLQDVPAPIDVAYLDSANNAGYILEEFKIVVEKMPEGFIIIDDVNLESKQLLKGDQAVPYAREKGYDVKLLERQAVIMVTR